MSISANVITKLYDLFPRVPDSIDFFYFPNAKRNPRNCMVESARRKELLKNVIDICGGSGAVTLRFAKAFPNASIECVDSSKGMLKILEKRLKKMQLKNVHAVKGDAKKLTYPNDTFDFAMISLVLHELSEEDVSRIMNEAFRVLKEDGILCLAEWEKPNTLFRKFMFWFLKINEPKTFESFVSQDFNEFFKQHHFTVREEIKCDFSRIFVCEKEKIND